MSVEVTDLELDKYEVIELLYEMGVRNQAGERFSTVWVRNAAWEGTLPGRKLPSGPWVFRRSVVIEWAREWLEEKQAQAPTVSDPEAAEAV